MVKYSSRLLLHTVSAAVITIACGLLATSASATISFLECPTWGSATSSNLPAASVAADVGFQNSNIASSCKPIAVGTCTPGANDLTVKTCIGTETAQCGGFQTSIQVVGTGPPVTGNQIFKASDPSSKTRCAISFFEPDPQKGKGPPPCPLCGKGNPVNAGTGNKYQREVDITPTGEGELEFVRYYNSAGPYASFGVGSQWTHSWSRSLYILPTEIDATRPDGKRLAFTLVSSVWTPDLDVPERLGASGSNWILTTADNAQETYSSAGKLLSVTSPSGKVTTLSYSDGTGTAPNGQMNESNTRPLPPGLLIHVTDFRGRSLSLGYDANGNLVRMTDAAGQVYHYAYDTSIVAGAMLSVQYPDSSTRTYIYNESANTSGANLPYTLTGITDENGARFATFKYATNRKAISSEHAGGVEKYQFTFNSGSTTIVDPLGTTLTSPVSAIANTQQLTGTTRSCTGCGANTTETYTFDTSRNPTSYKDFNGNLTCSTFGSLNLETARTEGLSGSGTCASRVTTSATRTITKDWHATWRIPKRIAELLKITTFAYNGDTGVSCAPSGAATTLVCSKTVQATTDTDGSQGFSATSDGAARVWSYTYNLAGQVLSIDGPRTDVTDVTAYSYYTSDDPSGNYKAGDLASITNAKGQVTQFTQYDAAGRLKKSTDPNGLETLLSYSSRGWITQRQVGNATAGYETTVYDHDYVGQLAKVTLPDSSFVQYTYDNAHRLWKINDGLGNRIEYTLDNMGNRTAENAYDTSNTLVRTHTRVIDGLNRLFKDIGGTTPSTQVTQNGFDANGNVTSILDPLGRTTTREFDALNRLTAVKDPFNGTSHPTSFQFNRQGSLTQVTDPSGLSTTYTVNGHGETTGQSSPDTGSTSFTFDAASNLATKTYARSVQAVYSYDELNRITQIVYPDETVTYTWDSCTNGIGRLCSITDKTGTTSYTLDLWGRVIGKSQTVGTVTQSMGCTFNAAGQLATITTPSGRSVVYTYSNNRPVSVTVDGVNILNSVFYEPFGPNGGWKWGNSTMSVPNTHTRVFDKDFRMTRVTSDLPASGSQPYFDKQVGWDIQSRVASVTDLANSALSASYGFDALDRLTSVTQGSNTWGYSFNGTGDRLTSTVNSATTNYGYSSGTHRLASLSGAQSKTYSVDAAGNMTSDGSSTWVYGGNNRPTSAGSLTVFINALGQRVKKDNGTTVTRFVFDEAGRLWGEYDNSGALIQETVWLDDVPVATLRPNVSGVDVFYVHADHLGTPRAVTRLSDNQFTWKWDNTEAFGNSPTDENPSSLGTFAYNLRYPGQYFDQETGTHYNYKRDYDPRIGRYVESDAIGLAGGLNTFAYVSGRPLTLRDLQGLCESIIETKVGDWHVVDVKVDELGEYTLKNPKYEVEYFFSVCVRLKGYSEWRARLLQSTTFEHKDKFARVCTTCTCDGVSRCGEWTNVGGDMRERWSTPWPDFEYLGFFPVEKVPCVEFPMPWDLPR